MMMDFHLPFLRICFLLRQIKNQIENYGKKEIGLHNFIIYS